MYNKVPFISVIIPVYNTEKYLKRCLDSIINQTFKDIEIIIVDDCSPGYCGNCKDIAEGYKDSRIIYTRNEKNSGSAWSRINGFNYSHGKYIHFVDSDDWLADESYVKICN